MLKSQIRSGTSRRHPTKWAVPRLGGPKYILVGAADRCLVLEDLLPRQLRFRAWLGSSAKIVNRSADAISELHSHHFDVVFLDRDLGIGAGFGEDVCAELVRIKFTGRAILHTTNPFAGVLMVRMLSDGDVQYEIAPFDVLGVLREARYVSSGLAEATQCE